MYTDYMQHNLHKICTCDYVNMLGTSGSLIVLQYVWYSIQFNGDTICVVQHTV